jgi:hypothetical protein
MPTLRVSAKRGISKPSASTAAATVMASNRSNLLSSRPQWRDLQFLLPTMKPSVAHHAIWCLRFPRLSWGEPPRYTSYCDKSPIIYTR